MILEVCVDSYESLLTAKRAGADRIELCSALNLGGLTPSMGLMKKARELEGLEIFVMIRPRSGDFLYSEEDYAVMKEDIRLVKALGFDGIVLGFLNAQGGIDLERTREAAELAYPLKVAFHRAFDDARDPDKDLPALIDIGVIRILSSGQRASALEGADYLARLQREFGSRITIMPGSGITSSNIKEIVELTGCSNYHMSGKLNRASAMVYRDYVKRMGTSEKELVVEVADFQRINEVKRILDTMKGDSSLREDL